MRTKRISVLPLTLAFVFIFVAGIFSYGRTAFAEEEETPLLEDLGGNLAEITYRNYVLYGTGRYFSYEINYDYTFYQQNKVELNDRMQKLRTSFESNGYEVTIDTVNGKLVAFYNFETTEEYYAKATDYDGFAVNESSASNVKKSFFYNEYTSQFKTVFVGVDKGTTLVGRLYTEGCKKAGIPTDKLRLCYVYGTPYATKTIWTDADKTSFDRNRNLNLHTFYMTYENADRTLTITQRAPNTSAWYLVALGIFAVVSAALITLYAVKKRSK